MLTLELQHKLEVNIKGFKLPRKRVEKWCQRKWGVGINSLNVQQVAELMTKFPVFSRKLRQEQQNEKPNR